MKVIVQGSGPVQLSQSDFVATGGQASVWVKDGMAYKIYTDRKDVIPTDKFVELKEIVDSCVIRPKALLLDGSKVNEPVGFAMLAVPENHSLCQLFVPAFKEREKLEERQIVEVAAQLQDRVRSVHAADVLVVDLNELNVLVSKQFDRVFLIDTDSFQTKHFPATVVMPSVRDWSAGTKFTKLSDWYSYAILAFQLFVGAHPFKGNFEHPEIATVPKDGRVEWRMRRNLSAFRKEAKLPACCLQRPFAAIPAPFRNWLEAVLDGGGRAEPPNVIQVPTLSIPTPTAPRVLVASGDLDIELLARAKGLIVVWDEGLCLERDGSTPTVSRAPRSFSGDACRDLASGTVLLGFSPKMKHPLALRHSGMEAVLYDFEHGKKETLPMRVDEIAKAGERFLFRSGASVQELDFLERPDGVRPLPGHRVADVLPRASRLFEGCVVQDVLGSTFVSLFPRARAGHQMRVEELDGRKVLDAKFQWFKGGGVLMALTARGGKYARVVLRWDDDWSGYDVRVVDDVSPGLVNFAVTESGTVVCLDEEERLEVFRANAEHPALRLVESDLLGGDLRLCRVPGGVGFTRGSELYRLRLK